MDPASKARRFTINIWGIASVILFVGDLLVSQYSFSLQYSGRAPFSTVENYEQAVVANLAALVCGIIAVRRGSNWWLFVVLAAVWAMIVNFLGEL